MNKTTNERHCVTTPITHCPWCGNKLNAPQQEELENIQEDY